ncbi:MAG TPA: histidine kinase dimerization/phospho-acceptor domain-containing protein [Myxococcales bacterium]|jgi:two-component system sensor histidine kinase KdpD
MSSGKRGKYLGFVAHEIKNPLATALWSCDLLKRMEGADRTGERAEKMIDVSLRALRRMRRLIDDYFTIERLGEAGYDLPREEVTLKDLIAPLLPIMAEKDGIPTDAWTLELGEDRIKGDVDMLRRGIRAALEYMARGASGKSRLAISARPGPVVLIRAETPPNPLLPPPPEDRQSGDPTGAILGFALASRILEAHGGRIEERDGALALSFG